MELGKIGIISNDPLLPVALLREGMELLGVGISYSRFEITPVVTEERGLVGYLIEQLPQADLIIKGESTTTIVRYY